MKPRFNPLPKSIHPRQVARRLLSGCQVDFVRFSMESGCLTPRASNRSATLSYQLPPVASYSSRRQSDWNSCRTKSRNKMEGWFSWSIRMFTTCHSELFSNYSSSVQNEQGKEHE